MEQFFNDSRTLSQLRDGPIEAYLNAFAEQLRNEGFTHDWACHQIRVAADFSRWLRLNRVPTHEINREHTTKYLKYRTRTGRSKAGDTSIMKRILQLLRREGVIEAEASLELTPTDELADEFVSYLLKERSLASSTVIKYRDFIKRFLNDRFNDNPVDLSILEPSDIVSFVQRQAARIHVKQAQYLTTSLRSFLRYATYRGYTDINLSAAVPTVANWSKATIPKALPAESVALVLESCSRQSAASRRDYAVLMLLARLGLRAGEVASLTLDDIDWQAGCLTICGKGRHWAQLPLPADVGDAIVDYLRHGRPQTNSRSLFLTAKAPRTGFTSQGTVGNIVKRALARAGINTSRNGAHQFRHALATQMLSRSASLSEIGEVLRHRSPQTTEIYIKVDLVSLRSIALAWPGGLQ